MQSLMQWITFVNDHILWHDYVLYVLLFAGVLFTVWSGFSQYRALTHGVQVIRGKYDRHDDPGAINHFQALSAALSATVGLGNIAGVAFAISTGGPGAVFWMWVVGLVGMALKLTEVTQAMLYRNVDDPENPHGGAMWVCQKGFARISPALAPLGWFVGAIFCITLLISTITGGNMFQAWNVADICYTYFSVPQYVSGIVMTLLVGLVIIGGIKRIGSVAGRLVPFMCLLYILAGLYVIIAEIDRVPAMLRLIFTEAFSPTQGVGAFLGGTAGYGFLKGMQRALFSNEAGQGSAPIAHSAAKTDEPVREGVVAGLEPFIDTICVCSITAVVILLSGTWNRDPSLRFDTPAQIIPAVDESGAAVAGAWTLAPTTISERNAARREHVLQPGQPVYVVVQAGTNATTGLDRHALAGTLARAPGGGWTVDWAPLESSVAPTVAVDGVYLNYNGATLTAKAFDTVLPGLGYWIVPATAWLFAVSTMISWSYYGEQGMVFLFGLRSVMLYRLAYCVCIMLACVPQIIGRQDDMETLSTLGTGVMLWANIPIMLIFGPEAMRAYHSYIRRLRAGEFRGHAYPPIVDVAEGRDVR